MKKLDEIKKRLDRNAEDIAEIKKQIGYYRMGGEFFAFFAGYLKPSKSVSEKIDLILDYLGLEVQIQKERTFLAKKKEENPQEKP